MIDIQFYIAAFKKTFPQATALQPWEFINNLESILSLHLKALNSDYKIENNIAIHKTAIIEQGVVMKGNE